MNWTDIDFSDLNTGVYPPAQKPYEQWMCRPPDEKMAWSPWTDPDAPADCGHCGSTTEECKHSARYKWGWEGNYRDHDTAKRKAVTADVGGLVFIQLEADPFVFVDGDDVRDPETGDVHPDFLEILDRLGLSYADVSTSGAGVHVYYRGDLPDDDTTADWELDSEPWGGNEDEPEIEIYSGKHVCLTTSDHIAETPEEVRPWDSEALREVLEEAGEATADDHAVLSSFDTGEQSAPAETPSQRSDDDAQPEGDTQDKSPVDHVNDLKAQRVAGKTIVRQWNSSASTSDGEKAFLPTWGSSSDNGTANIVNSDWWVDTGGHGGSGGPIEMAAIDLGILDERHAEPGAVTGEDWWRAYEHLQDQGFDLPDRDGESEYSDYYDAPLNEHTDGDAWSDPDAMLEACLEARARGVVAEDADPPMLALVAIADELLGEEEVGDGTREMLAGVYHEEMNVTDAPTVD